MQILSSSIEIPWVRTGRILHSVIHPFSFMTITILIIMDEEERRRKMILTTIEEEEEAKLYVVVGCRHHNFMIQECPVLQENTFKWRLEISLSNIDW